MLPADAAVFGSSGDVAECEEGIVWVDRSSVCRSSAPLSPWSPRVTATSDARRGAQVGCIYTGTP